MEEPDPESGYHERVLDLFAPLWWDARMRMGTVLVTAPFTPETTGHRLKG